MFYVYLKCILMSYLVLILWFFCVFCQRIYVYSCVYFAFSYSVCISSVFWMYFMCILLYSVVFPEYNGIQ